MNTGAAVTTLICGLNLVAAAGSHLICVLRLEDPLCADLDLWPDEVSVEELVVLEAAQLAHVLAGLEVVGLAALVAALGLERHLALEEENANQRTTQRSQTKGEVAK